MTIYLPFCCIFFLYLSLSLSFFLSFFLLLFHNMKKLTEKKRRKKILFVPYFLSIYFIQAGLVHPRYFTLLPYTRRRQCLFFDTPFSFSLSPAFTFLLCFAIT